MGTGISRRDILRLAGGGALGFLLTPVPWKLLSDSSVWTQNWPWIPQPLRGEVTTRFTVCSLCPKACPVKARCIGSQPISLAPVRHLSPSYGALCALGFAAHQLPFHPARVPGPGRLAAAGDPRFSPCSLDSIVGELRDRVRAGQGGGTRCAIFDQQPGRMVSGMYRKLAARIPDGLYVTPGREGSPLLSPLHHLLDSDRKLSLGLDLSAAATIVSFGVPLVEYWETSGAMADRLRSTRDGRRGAGGRCIQIESGYSRSAQFADEWIPVRPGAEILLALAIANVIVQGNLIDGTMNRGAIRDLDDETGTSYRDLVGQFSPESVSVACGVPVPVIQRLAREMVSRRPTAVLSWHDPLSGIRSADADLVILGLNVLLGSVGGNGPINHTLPDISGEVGSAASALDEVPDHSLRLLILDPAESGYPVPWEILERKLVPGTGTVVSLSPYLAGYATRAEYVVPSPAYLELFQDMVSAPVGKSSRWSLSVPLKTPPAGAVDPIVFAELLASALGVESVTGGIAREELLKQVVAAMYLERKGELLAFQDGSSVEIEKIGSTDQLWKTLSGGGMIVRRNDNTVTPEPGYRLLGRVPDAYRRMLNVARESARRLADGSNPYPLAIVPFLEVQESLNGDPLPPALTKLYQESNLRRGSNQARLNPATAKRHGLIDGEAGLLETDGGGTLSVKIYFDESVTRDSAIVTCAPDNRIFAGADPQSGSSILSLCCDDHQGVLQGIIRPGRS